MAEGAGGQAGGVAEAFVARDRGTLLQRARPLFAHLKRDHRVTHLYFEEPDRTCWLRVPQPDRHGDIIDRQTARTAQLPQTLASVLDGLAELFGVEIELLVRKAFVDRPGWESGMAMLGRPAARDALDGYVLSGWSGRVTPVAAQVGAGLDLSEAAPRASLRRDVTASRRQAQRAALGVGLASLLLGGLVLWVLLRRLTRFEKELLRLSEEGVRLTDLTRSDPLTGVHNRREFDRLLDAEWERAQRLGRPLSLLMVDLDHFKRINDTAGHPAGDDVLRRTAQLLEAALRPSDHVARYGGEEFAVLMPGAGAHHAMAAAERLRRQVGDTTLVPLGPEPMASVTVSIGVASRDGVPADAGSEVLVQRADKALYQAKRFGRNVVSGGPPPPLFT